MKHQVLNHPKTARLAEELGIDRAYALGIVGALWCFAAEYAFDGDLSQHTPQQLASNIGFNGDPVRMVCALCAHKWLDQTEDGRTLIHDWPEHCPDFIHMRLVRMNKRFANGQLAKTSRLKESERENYNPPEVCAQKAHAVRMPCALSNPTQPNPIQSNLTQPPSAPAADAAVCEIPKTPHPKSEYSPEFEAFWSAYPAEGRKAKAGAWKAWKKLKPSQELQLRMVAAIEGQIEHRATIRSSDPKAFIPCWKHCATWINNGCWNDELAEPVKPNALPEFAEPVEPARGPRPWKLANDHPIWLTLKAMVDPSVFGFLDDYEFGVAEDEVYIVAPSKFALDLHFRLNDKLDQLRDIVAGINDLVTVKLDW